MSNIKVFALGGLDEKGKDLYVLDIDNDLYVLDFGYRIPNNVHLGVRHIIPNTEYLVKNKNRIKGFFISSIDFDQWGSYPFLIDQFKDVPIYCGIGTKFAIEEFLKRHQKSLPKFNIISNNQEIKFRTVIFQPFTVSYSMPDTFAFIFKTKDGNVIYLINSIFEFLLEYQGLSLEFLSHISNQNNLLLLIDSTNAKLAGFASTKVRIDKKLFENVIKIKNNRKIFVLYDNDILNILTIISLAKEYNKQIAILGLSTNSLLNFLIKENKIEKSNFINVNDIEKYNDVWIIISGNGGRIWNKLYKIALNEEPLLTIRENDQILIASPEYPGNERIATEAMNELNKICNNLINIKASDKIFMNPSKEDIKTFLNFIKPKYLMPIKGYYLELDQVKQIAYDLKYQKDQLIIGYNGEVFNFIDGSYYGKIEKIKAISDVIVDDNTNVEISLEIIKEREHLSQYGYAIFGFMVSKSQKMVISSIDTKMHGVMFIKQNDVLINNLNKMIHEEVVKSFENNQYKNLKQILESKLGNHIKKQIKKNPFVNCEIIFVD